MKNRCVVRHCGRKGVYHRYNTYETYCELHKHLGMTPEGEYGPEPRWWHRYGPDYGSRLHEGRKTPRAKRLKDRWHSA